MVGNATVCCISAKTCIAYADHSTFDISRKNCINASFGITSVMMSRRRS